MLFRLKRLGIEAGKPFDPSILDAETIATINQAAQDTLAGMQAAWERTGKVVNGWTLQNENIGTYGTSYLKRAIVAKGGLGANLPLFALTGTWQSSLGLVSVEAVLFLLAMIPLSSAYWLVSERLRGGVPAAVALHLVGNAALTFLAVTSPLAMAVYVGVIVLTSVLIHLVTRPGAPRP